MTEGMHVRISNHFFYTDFGIRDSGEMRYGGRRFVMTDAPGTGFIERESESHSYNKYVRSLLAQQKPSYFRMLTGKEPDFDRILNEANRALMQSNDKQKRDFLECYVNALTVARTEERFERIIRGIKDKMGHRSNKFMVSVMSHYKSKIRQLENDLSSVIWHVKDHCSEETYAAYCEMVDAFTHVAACRRIWFLDSKRKSNYTQVFFDMGVFDFIRSKDYIPMMRTPTGVTYYLLPDVVIAARSSTNFEIVPLKTLTVVCQELSIEESTEAMTGHLGDVVSMIRIPEFDLSYYFNHLSSVVKFVQALDKLKETL